jgi:two-component system cell cycle sensor histidine kinase/response regulator CckA
MATILVVDDEPSIRHLVGRVLERKGHRVISCGSAAEAMAIPGPIDALLVDLILPEVGGRQLTEALRERWPRLPVLLMSGYPPPRDGLPSSPSSFLQKPMMPAAIVEAIEALLLH